MARRCAPRATPISATRSKSPASSPTSSSTTRRSSPRSSTTRSRTRVATPEQIEKLFGANVARLVDGVTKLSKIEAQSENERAAENLRKFLLALSRRHPRAAGQARRPAAQHAHAPPHHQSEEKRRRIAKETMDIYAPLAERIGMYEIMNEMQRLAFQRARARRLRLDHPAAAAAPRGRRRPRQPDRPRASSSTSPTTASRPRSRAARSIPSRSGRRWPSGTSASSNCPTSWRSG